MREAPASIGPLIVLFGRLAIAGLVTFVVGLIALFALIESADVLGAKSWFERHEGRPASTTSFGDTPNESSLPVLSG